ncbi:MAG TPA: hypothetical protein VN886_14730 [Acidimicrobiales bacterium]|nr:hypothetical protein [Acidimicrobiales bacterium]
MDCDVTDCPDAPLSLIAGVPDGDDPAEVTNTWNDGPDTGAGEQLKAQPMFQPAAVVVKAGLVQLPCIWVVPKRTRAGPAAAADVEVVVDPPVPVVAVVWPAAAVVVVVALVAPAVWDVVAVADPEAWGRVYAGAFEEAVPPTGL